MRKLILTLFIILYGFGQMMAQRFPITVVPQINPPAPVNFYNYADQATINSPLRVQLLLSDITISNEQIRLKVYFEGNGIAFESRDVVIGASSLFIDGGVPLVLTNTTLAPYFEFQNIQGVNSNIYGSTIPEGSYQFCFEVFDFSTGNRLSSKTCASAFLYNNEPPLLNLPFKGANIEPTETENIVFQWTPRHINVSNVEYELSIVEIWDDQVDPQTAFLSQVPVFETTTKSTSFVYGPAQPQLLPEKRYAWRVKAKALQGIEEVGLFKNEGNSEIFWFSKTSPCSMLDNVTAAPKGISKINVFWGEDPSEYSEYTIAYREANRPNAYWFTKRTNSGWTTIWDLKPGTTYEYKVKAKCKYQYGKYSDIQEVTTDTTQDETANYDCGITPDPIAIANQEGHPGLKIGDRITAGDFIVRIVEIDNQADGRITGRGYVGIPYLRSTHYGVKFNNILINTENQLAEGEIVTLYDPVYGESETMTVDINTDVVEIITGDEGETSQVEVGFIIESITVDENGAVIITGTNGEEALVPGGRDLQISGSDGKVWKVEENGTVRALDGVMAEDGPATDDNTEGVEDNKVIQISETGVLITFIESGYYNFDALPDSAKDKLGTEEFYPSIPVVGGGTYTPAFKAISNISGNDFVKAVADFSDDSIANEDIVFKTKSGVEVPASWDKNVATLTLKKSYDYAITKILATVKKGKGEKSTIAGVLNVVHLGSKAFTNVNIVLIPVNKAKVNRVEGEIKKIYSKVGVNFNITVGQRFQVPESIWDKEEPYGVLNAGDSGVLSHYSAEEAAINAYFKTTSEYKQDAYYVFVTDLKGVNSNENREIEGFMPLKSQFGYIFQSSTDDARTIAHELGHGVFGLEHPFEEYGTTEATTHFMMDYKGGTAFNHMDWKNIFAPGFKLYWFQDDDEGQYTNTEFVDKIFQIIRCAHINTTDPNGVISFNTSVFGKTGTFGTKWKGSDIKIKIDKGSFEGKAVYEPVEIGKNPESGKKNWPWRYSLLYENVEIYILRTSTGADPRELNRLREYLFPKDKSQIRDETNKIVKEILQNNKLTKEHFEQLKSIANCGIQYFSAETRYRIISKIVSTLETNNDWLTEYYEDLILDLLETPPSKDRRSFNNEILQFLLDDYVLLEKLFKQTQDVNAAWLWAGNENNFSRLLNVLYKLWNNSKYEDESAYAYIDYVADYSTPRTSHLIHYDGKSWFPNVTYDSAVFNKEHLIIPADMGNRQGALKYRYYQPVMVIFENGDNSKVTKKIPAIIFAGNVKRDNLRKNLEKAELVIDVVLTGSGVGNLAKLKHLKNVGRISSFFEGLKGLDVLVSTANLLVKYSKPCDSPKQPQTKKEKTYCDMLGIFGDVLGLGIGYGDLVKRSAKLKKTAGQLHKEIKDNPDLIPDGADREKTLKGLREIAGRIGNNTSLEELWRIYKDRNLFATILNSFENVKLGLSTVDTLLKYLETCKTDETCKAVQFYLGIIQKAIKVKDLGKQLNNKLTKPQETELKKGAADLLNKVKSDPKFLKDKPEERKRLIEGLEVTEGIRIPKLKTVLFDLPENKHQNIKQLYDNASPDKKASLEKSWEILEPFRNIRFANDGKNLEILAKTHDRFTYDGQDSFLGFKKLMVEGSTANKQKLIDGLEEANKIFDSKLELPIKFSGIKKGEVKIVDSENTEIARIDTEGNLIKKKFLDEADGAEVAGKYKEDVILRKGKEVGFKLNNTGGELAKAWKPGWNKQKVLDMGKGNRPNPSEYLIQKYIDAHIAKFTREGIASRIVLKKDYEKYGVGKPDKGKTEYVSTKSEIDRILKLPLSERSKKLGIPESQLEGGEVIRIDFKLTSKYKVEMPTGNEFGTNPQWIPGGKLPEGDLEGIIKTEGMIENIDYIAIDLN